MFKTIKDENYSYFKNNMQKFEVEEYLKKIVEYVKDNIISLISSKIKAIKI